MCRGALGRLSRFEASLPLVTRLRNPGLRDRHWAELSSRSGVALRPEPSLTLTRLVEIQTSTSRFDELVAEVGGLATQEHVLEQALDKMAAAWRPMTLEATPYGQTGTCVLCETSTGEVRQVLEMQISQALEMRGSPFVAPFVDRIAEWQKKLLSMQAIFDAWHACQEVWLLLEPIVSSTDLMRQMPSEARRLAAVDQLWRKIMALTVRHPSVLRMCTTEKLLDKFREANRLLDTPGCRQVLAKRGYVLQVVVERG